MRPVVPVDASDVPAAAVDGLTPPVHGRDAVVARTAGAPVPAPVAVHLVVAGTARQPVVSGATRQEDMSGGASNDTLTGSAASNLLIGDQGNDTVDGAAGFDLLTLGGGDDTANARDGVPDAIRCGSGNDTANVDNVDLVASDCETVNRPMLLVGPASMSRTAPALPLQRLSSAEPARDANIAS
jgi:RTX calcium-binding nonapeptide repeat (4 copies)